MLVTIINPPIVDRRYNFTYSVDIPLGPAYIASYLMQNKIEVEVVDALGEGLGNRRVYKKDFMIIGLRNKEIIRRISKDTKLISISARYTTQHNVIINLIKYIKMNFKKNPEIPLVIGGNHATYHYKEMLKAGADYVIIGEGEKHFLELCNFIQGRRKTLPKYILSKKDITKKDIKIEDTSSFIKNIDELPFPARELFPLENYFSEKSGFGPSNKRFTSITSSRGCPNACTYCSSAVFWKRIWRPRSPKNVVDEIEHCINRHGIREFHFIDDNLTLNRQRMAEICNEIIKRNLNITWGATNGIRPENVDIELLKLMKNSGCNQITVAPESGSQRILKQYMNKSIDLGKVIDIVRNCNRLGIRTTAYFVVGVIGENKRDRKLTKGLVSRLARSGLDEIGVFPLIPYPECPITESYKHIKQIRNYEELCTGFVPEWYPDYRIVKSFKNRLYMTFFIRQLLHHPEKIVRLATNLIAGRQEIKSDRVAKNMLNTFFRRRQRILRK